MKKKYLSCLNVCFISSYQRSVIGLVTFRLTLVLSSSFVEIQKFKRADQDGCHFTIMTLLPRDITPLLLVANIKEAYSFWRTIYPRILIVIAFIFAKLWRGAIPPPMAPEEKNVVDRVEHWKLYWRVRKVIIKFSVCYKRCNWCVSHFWNVSDMVIPL